MFRVHDKAESTKSTQCQQYLTADGGRTLRARAIKATLSPDRLRRAIQALDIADGRPGVPCFIMPPGSRIATE